MTCPFPRELDPLLARFAPAGARALDPILSGAVTRRRSDLEPGVVWRLISARLGEAPCGCRWVTVRVRGRRGRLTVTLRDRRPIFLCDAPGRGAAVFSVQVEEHIRRGVVRAQQRIDEEIAALADTSADSVVSFEPLSPEMLAAGAAAASVPPPTLARAREVAVLSVWMQEVRACSGLATLEDWDCAACGERVEHKVLRSGEGVHARIDAIALPHACEVRRPRTFGDDLSDLADGKVDRIVVDAGDRQVEVTREVAVRAAEEYFAAQVPAEDATSSAEPRP